MSRPQVASFRVDVSGPAGGWYQAKNTQCDGRPQYHQIDGTGNPIVNSFKKAWEWYVLRFPQRSLIMKQALHLTASRIALHPNPLPSPDPIVLAPVHPLTLRITSDIHHDPPPDLNRRLPSIRFTTPHTPCFHSSFCDGMA